MRLLLDTHTFLWFVLDDPALSTVARSHIVDPANAKYLSPASYWEIGIKMSVGKYSLAVPHDVFFETTIADNGFVVLHILPSHTAVVATRLVPPSQRIVNQKPNRRMGEEEM